MSPRGIGFVGLPIDAFDATVKIFRDARYRLVDRCPPPNNDHVWPAKQCRLGLDVIQGSEFNNRLDQAHVHR